MRLYNIFMNLINLVNKNDLLEICKHIGTDLRALKYLEPKKKIYHVYGAHIDYRAAAFMKQEMLSRGGDCVVAKHVIDGKTDYSDVLLIGTRSEFERLLIKLASMDCWGLKRIREELAEILKALDSRVYEINLPGNKKLTLGHESELMAIINLTPDSFYEGSRITSEAELLTRVEKFLNDGAKIIDLGAESTRPNYKPVDENEELQRLMPALKILRREFPDVIISIDTYKSKIAEAAFNEGADIINDISGFNYDDRMPETIARLKIPYVLSHIKDESESHDNLLDAMILYFRDKLQKLEINGIDRNKIIIDPGIGFGKTQSENYLILKNIEAFKIFDLPVLIGHSRKRCTGLEKLSGTLAITAMLCDRVNILRVHDVKENSAALEISRAINKTNI